MKTNYLINLASEKLSYFKHAPLFAIPNRDVGVQTKDGFDGPQHRSSASTSLQITTPSSTPIDKISHLFKDAIINYKSLGGGENFVYLINDQWIFRIPKQDNALCANRREQILLKELNECMKSTLIPSYRFWDHETGIGGYEEIKGIALSYEFYNRLNSSEKSALAHDLALAISELHDLPIKKTPFLKTSAASAKEYVRIVGSAFGPPSIFSKLDAKRINEALTITEAIIAKTDPSLVVIHSDLHCDNILVNPSAKRLSGLIDFSEARIGPAVIDFSNLYRVSPQLAEATTEIYARTKNIDSYAFLKECRAWSIIWQAACIAQNYHGATLREQKRVMRAGRALNYLLALKKL